MDEGKTSYGMAIFLSVIVFLSCMTATRNSEKEAYQDGFNAATEQYGEEEHAITLDEDEVANICVLLDEYDFDYEDMDIDHAIGVLYVGVYEDLAYHGYDQSDLINAYDIIRSFLDDMRERRKEAVSIINDKEFRYYTPQY